MSIISDKGNTAMPEGYRNKPDIGILLAGDLCPINATLRTLLDGKSKEIIAPLGSGFFDRDLAIVNLEGSITDEGWPIRKTGPNLKIDPACMDFIKAAGFEIVTLANNHTGDFGPGALQETMRLLDRNGILHAGAGKNLDDSGKPLLLEKNGIKIALLSYAEYEFGMAGKDMPGACPLDPLTNIRDIKNTSSRVDITLVVIHSGNEHCPIPNPATVNTYRAFADAGASAVIGMHTHCPQGFEIYNGVPIVYSLGNFLFDYPYDCGRPEKGSFWWKGYMVKIVFSAISEGVIVAGRFAASVETVPYSFWPDGSSIIPLAGDERDGFLRYLEHISGIIAEDSELNSLWDAWCLMNGPWWMDCFRKVRCPAAPENTDEYANTLALRNGFTCSAHYEVIKNFLRIHCENRAGLAEKHIDRMKMLMKGIIP